MTAAGDTSTLTPQPPAGRPKLPEDAQDASAAAGLSSSDASRLQSEWGPNEPVPRKAYSQVRQALRLLLDPLALLLLTAAGLSAVLGQKTDAVIIVVMVLLGAALNAAQTIRSQNAMERLRGAVHNTCCALRDGSWVEIPQRDLVPGDVIRLYAGDLVPADAFLIQANDLFIQQAALTGESQPVTKSPQASAIPSADPNEPGMVFQDSSVVSGYGMAQVTATGTHTVFGQIAGRLASRPPETEFERSLRQFGMLIMRVVFCLVCGLLAFSLVLRHQPFESFLFAIALAVGLTPEFLPMITSVTLANGARRMAKRSVIVKHLPAIQNLGSIDILCSDKTGTLTRGEMRLVDYRDASDTQSNDLLRWAALGCRFESGIQSPLNAATLQAASAIDVSNGWRKLGELPFGFERRRSAVAVEDNSGQRWLIVKGAPESVLPLCTRIQSAESSQPITAAHRASINTAFQEASSQGHRVLSVALRPLTQATELNGESEGDLIFSGLLHFSDPPRPDAHQAVHLLNRDGVKLKVLTGDNELVARSVCSEVGLSNLNVVLGSELELMSDPALDHIVEVTDIFARVSPAQKNRIILALKRRSHVVGYIGDGINDAPSLHTADVGISVDNAADVAREAADIILLQPGLHVVHSGILEGRKASGNVLKYLLMGTSSNFGNMLSMAAASLFLPFLPMLPTQILFNNFLYDLAQVTIPTDRVDRAYLRVPQRWSIRSIQRFMLVLGPLSSLFDVLTFYLLLSVMHASQAEFHTGWFVESLATQSLVLLVIRTAGKPWQFPPSPALLSSVLAVVAAGVAIPFLPFARFFGFVPLPGSFFFLLLGITIAYLTLVHLIKQRLFAKLYC